MISSLLQLAPLETTPERRTDIAIPHSRPYFDDDLVWAARQVGRNGYIGCGEQVRLFESEIAELHEAAGGVATNSGTAALHLALMALKIGPDDEVILPSYVCTAVLNAVRYVGASPVLTDLDEDSFNLDPEDVERRLTSHTKAIIVPHLFGNPADILSIRQYGVPVIEDCAQAFGATVGEKPVGGFGEFAVFSFYATKVITTGQGGMVIAKSREWVEKMRDLRDYDEKENYLPRYNYQISDLSAAIGRRQLRRLPGFLDRRRELAAFYARRLEGIEDLKLPAYQPGSIFYRYVIRTNRAQALESALFKVGIEAKRPVYSPLHHYIGGNFPKTDSVHRTALSLPLYPALSDAEAILVADEASKAMTPRHYTEPVPISNQAVAEIEV